MSEEIKLSEAARKYQIVVESDNPEEWIAETVLCFLADETEEEAADEANIHYHSLEYSDEFGVAMKGEYETEYVPPDFNEYRFAVPVDVDPYSLMTAINNECHESDTLKCGPVRIAMRLGFSLVADFGGKPEKTDFRFQQPSLWIEMVVEYEEVSHE